MSYVSFIEVGTLGRKTQLQSSGKYYSDAALEATNLSEESELYIVHILLYSPSSIGEYYH